MWLGLRGVGLRCDEGCGGLCGVCYGSVEPYLDQNGKQLFPFMGFGTMMYMAGQEQVAQSACFKEYYFSSLPPQVFLFVQLPHALVLPNLPQIRTLQSKISLARRKISSAQENFRRFQVRYFTYLQLLVMYVMV